MGYSVGNLVVDRGLRRHDALLAGRVNEIMVDPVSGS
jgi:hypothetical protein